MRLLLIVVMLTACVDEAHRVRRWPDHRRLEDQRMIALESKVTSLEEKVRVLEAALKERSPVAAPPPAQ